MQHQDLVLGRANQAFVFDPPEGRPSAPAVHVLDGDRVIPATTGPCIVDPVEAQLQSDARAGGTTLRLTDATGIAPGGRYLLTGGEREWIVVSELRGDTLVLDRPLVHNYAEAAALVGCRISVAADPAWTGSHGNLSERRGGLAGYLVRWSYSIDGHEMTAISFADLVSCAANELVTPAEVDRRFPGFLAGLPAEHRANHGADFITEAVRAIRLEAVGDAHAQRRIRDTKILRELINARADMIRIEHGVMHGNGRLGELAIAEKRYRALYGRLVALPKFVDEPPPPPPAPPRKPKTTLPGMPVRIPKLTKL
jgi:hypothetical protein